MRLYLIDICGISFGRILLRDWASIMEVCEFMSMLPKDVLSSNFLLMFLNQCLYIKYITLLWTKGRSRLSMLSRFSERNWLKPNKEWPHFGQLVSQCAHLFSNFCIHLCWRFWYTCIVVAEFLPGQIWVQLAQMGSCIRRKTCLFRSVGLSY